MNVSTWCIKNPIAAIMFFVMLCFAGVLGYQNVKVQNFPDLDVPNIIITVSKPGYLQRRGAENAELRREDK